MEKKAPEFAKQNRGERQTAEVGAKAQDPNAPSPPMARRRWADYSSDSEQADFGWEPPAAPPPPPRLGPRAEPEAPAAAELPRQANAERAARSRSSLCSSLPRGPSCRLLRALSAQWLTQATALGRLSPATACVIFVLLEHALAPGAQVAAIPLLRVWAWRNIAADVWAPRWLWNVVFCMEVI